MISETQAKKYCSEDISEIENYEQAVADTTQMWDCHHKLEIQGQFRNSISLLKKCHLYYDVPAWQLVFLTKADHTRLHNTGNHHSEESRKKMSMSQSSEKSYWFGKRRSEESRKKMSMARSGKYSGEKAPMFGKHHSAEARQKLAVLNSGEKNPMFGKRGYWFGKHHSEETKKKCAAAFIGTHWWNNGIASKQKRECPGEGWVRGRLKRNQK